MRILRWIFGSITLIFFLVGFFGWLSIARGPSVDDDSVLHITFDGDLEEAPSSGLALVLGQEPQATLRSVLMSIERAASDDRILGIVLSVDNPSIGFAQLEEIAEAMELFRGSGKWSRSFLETVGETGPGDSAYALASLADEIILAPPGDVTLVGLRSEPLFYASALEKLNVEAHFEKRGEYKSAANQFVRREMDEPQRESLSALLEDLQSSLVAIIAKRRNTNEAQVRKWIADGPYSAIEAQELGLIDRLAYSDEVFDELRTTANRNDPLVSLATYWLEDRLHDSGQSVALIYGEGVVVRGEPSSGTIGQGPSMASDTLIGAFREARKEGVEAVVFRVDSPGGSYIASDLIRREVQLTREAGIPVVVSMGNFAASGGYFVAMDADRIFATPSTITGSIGVFTGLFNFGRALHDLGVTHDSIQTAPNADYFSQLAPIDERRRALVAKAADRVYADFTTKVADKRELPLQKVLTIAQGRVWSGRDALDHGLVDELGGLRAAIQEAKRLAKIDDDAEIDLVVWPKAESPLVALLNALEGTVQTTQALRGLREPLETAGKLWQSIDAMRGDVALLAPALPALSGH